MRRNDTHPEAETLAALAEGKLKRAEIPPLLAHVEHCESCMSALELASETAVEEGLRAEGPVDAWGKRTWWPMLAAAAVLVALVSVPGVRERLVAPFSGSSSSTVSRLVELAPRDVRSVEPRLSGGFAWASYRGPLRSTEAGTSAGRLKLSGAVGEAVERAERDDSPAAQQTAGVGMVLLDQPLEAVTRLELATAHAPENATAWSDLAAARYTAALHLGRRSLYPTALAAADRALALAPRHAEALFNRALILGRLGLQQEARAAWELYLTVDAASPWAAEAREHLKKIPEATGEERFKREQPRLESAAVAGDAATVLAIVRAFPQSSRTYGEAEYLGQWGEAVLRGDRETAARQFAIARAIGVALAAATGETLLRDAAAAIDAGDQKALASAHVIYRRGRITYAQRKPDAAEGDLAEAAARFAAAGSPMALVARYFLASAHNETHRASQSRRELEALLVASDARPSYAALRAQVRWALGLGHMVDADWRRTLPLFNEAEALFARGGERVSEAAIQSLLAMSLSALGQLEESWSATVRAFSTLSAEGNQVRMHAAVAAAAMSELRGGRPDAARAFLHIQEANARSVKNDLHLSETLVSVAMISETLGDHPAALRAADQAALAAARVADPSWRTRSIAGAALARGAVLLESDPAASRTQLTRAIDLYTKRELTALLPEPYLLRARAALRLGDRDAAALDLERGIAELERHPIDVADGMVGTGVLDAGAALYEEAIRLALARRDARGAFAYADRSHARLAHVPPVNAAAVDGLQMRLTGSDAAVLKLVVLPDEVIAFAVTHKEVEVTRTAIPRERLAVLAGRDDPEALTVGFDVLIRPSWPSIAKAGHLVIVADPRLQNVPFAALFDTSAKAHLIERMSVAMAPSAASLETDRPSAPRSVLTVALPSGEHVETRALAESTPELADIRAVYRHYAELPAERATYATFKAAAHSAEVVHISGHTEEQRGGGEPALLFAGGERVSWRTIASMPLARDGVVVLAACETLRSTSSPQTRSLSLGAGFLAAGAASVIGTLEPIADKDARELFAIVHRELAAGNGAAEAVRRAQLHALASGSGEAWKSLALLTKRIPAL